jgi:hypothetical protein
MDSLYFSNGRLPLNPLGVTAGVTLNQNLGSEFWGQFGGPALSTSGQRLSPATILPAVFPANPEDPSPASASSGQI